MRSSFTARNQKFWIDEQIKAINDKMTNIDGHPIIVIKRGFGGGFSINPKFLMLGDFTLLQPDPEKVKQIVKARNKSAFDYRKEGCLNPNKLLGRPVLASAEITFNNPPLKEWIASIRDNLQKIEQVYCS
jgi:hypothetical protein